MNRKSWVCTWKLFSDVFIFRSNCWNVTQYHFHRRKCMHWLKITFSISFCSQSALQTGYYSKMNCSGAYVRVLRIDSSSPYVRRWIITTRRWAFQWHPISGFHLHRAVQLSAAISRTRSLASVYCKESYSI